MLKDVKVYILREAVFIFCVYQLSDRVEPDLSGLEVSDEFVAETVGSCRKLMEEMVRWMFRVGAESEWFVFAGTILGFWILSRIGNLLDFHTFLFIGTQVIKRFVLSTIH